MSEILPRRRPSRVLEELKALGAPVTVFWTSLVASLTLFTLIIVVLLDNHDTDDFLALGMFWATTVGGTLLGQLLAMLRIRTSWVWLLDGVFVAGFLFVAAYSQEVVSVLGRHWDAILGLGMLLTAIYLMVGLWSLRVQTGVLAALGPVMYASASILIITEELNKDKHWFAGNKWAVWDISTGIVLAVAVLFLLLFLASKEHNRLFRWLRSEKAPDMPLQRRLSGGFNPLAGCGTVVMLFTLVVVLTVDSGVLAPYLWRTGPGDEPDDDGHPTEEPAPEPPPPEPQPQPAEPDPLDGLPQLPDMQPVQEAAKQAASAACMMFTLLFLALAVFFVFGPPVRRALLVQHLRRPLFPVEPTRTVQQNWRLVEIALADAGLPRKPGESAVGLARRAMEHLPDDLNAEALLHCAETVDRVIYGYGMGPDDIEQARRTADMAFEAVWERLSEWSKLRAMYRSP